MKKGIILVVLAAFVVMAFGAVVVAQDGMKTINQPAEKWPKGKKTKSTAETGVTFNHDKHGADLGCVECHHTQDEAKLKDGSEAAKSCFECHGPADEDKKPDAHKIIHDKKNKSSCLSCHKEKGGDAPTKCTACHPKA